MADETPLDNGTFQASIPAQTTGPVATLGDLWAVLDATRNLHGEQLTKLWEQVQIASAALKEFSDRTHADLGELGDPDLSSLTAALGTATAALVAELNRTNALAIAALPGGEGGDALPGQSLFDIARNTDWGKSAGWSGLIDLIAKLLPGAGPAVDSVLDNALGKAYPHSELRRSNIGETVRNALLEGFLKITEPVAKFAGLTGIGGGKQADPAVETGVAIRQRLIAGIFDAAEIAKKVIGDVARAFGWDFDSQKVNLEGVLFPGGPTDPDKAFDLGKQAMFRAGLAGVTAHTVSAILNAQILGIGGLNATGIAAAIGDLAGFGPIIGAMNQTWAEAAIQDAWQEHINERFRPGDPTPQQLFAMFERGIIGQAERDKNLAYQGGYPDSVIAQLAELHHVLPPMRYLADMADVIDADEAWWTAVLKGLGYRPADVPALRQATLRRRLNSQYAQLTTTFTNQFLAGQIDAADLRTALGDLDLAGDKVELLVANAEERARLEDWRDTLAELDTQFAAGLVDDEGYRAQLAMLFADPARATQHADLATAKRYKRQPLLTPTQEAATLVSAHRQLFLDGTETGFEYEAALRLAGLEGAGLAVTLARDQTARDKRIAADFRSFGLAALRDQFVHGMLNENQYRGQLALVKFPDVAIGAELALVKNMLTARTQARVQRYELPAYEESYFRGLIGADQLAAVRRRAGLTAAEVNAAALADRGKYAELLRKALAAAARQAQTQAKAAEAAAKKLAQATAAGDKAAAQAQAVIAKSQAAQAAAELSASVDGIAGDVPGPESAALEELRSVLAAGGELDPAALDAAITGLLDALAG